MRLTTSSSSPAAAFNLVNDLDLELVSPTGSIYRGNVFSNGASQTGGSADALNNVEAVRIPGPETGSWIVRVRAQTVPQPTQGYALAATGDDLQGARLFAPEIVSDLAVDHEHRSDRYATGGQPGSGLLDGRHEERIVIAHGEDPSGRGGEDPGGCAKMRRATRLSAVRDVWTSGAGGRCRLAPKRRERGRCRRRDRRCPA